MGLEARVAERFGGDDIVYERVFAAAQGMWLVGRYRRAGDCVLIYVFVGRAAVLADRISASEPAPCFARAGPASLLALRAERQLIAWSPPNAASPIGVCDPPRKLARVIDFIAAPNVASVLWGTLQNNLLCVRVHDLKRGGQLLLSCSTETNPSINWYLDSDDRCTPAGSQSANAARATTNGRKLNHDYQNHNTVQSVDSSFAWRFNKNGKTPTRGESNGSRRLNESPRRRFSSWLAPPLETGGREECGWAVGVLDSCLGLAWTWSIFFGQQRAAVHSPMPAPQLVAFEDDEPLARVVLAALDASTSLSNGRLHRHKARLLREALVEANQCAALRVLIQQVASGLQSGVPILGEQIREAQRPLLYIVNERRRKSP